MSLKSKWGQFKGTTQETFEANDPDNKKNNKFTYLSKDVTLFKPEVDKKSDSRVRFIGNTENNYIFFDTRIHFSIGSRYETSICPKWAFENLPSLPGAHHTCPMCDKAKELYDLARDADKEAAKPIKEEAKKYAAKQYSLAYVVDRLNANLGVQVWAISGTKTPENIRLLMKSRGTGGVINIEDLDEGYDVYFNKVSDNGGTGFPGILAIAKADLPSPLSTDSEEADAWLTFVIEHPFSQILNVMPVEEIERKVFGADVPDEDEDDKDDEKETISEVPEKSNVTQMEQPKSENKSAVAESASERLKRLKAASAARNAG